MRMRISQLEMMEKNFFDFCLIRNVNLLITIFIIYLMYYQFMLHISIYFLGISSLGLSETGIN